MKTAQEIKFLTESELRRELTDARITLESLGSYHFRAMERYYRDLQFELNQRTPVTGCDVNVYRVPSRPEAGWVKCRVVGCDPKTGQWFVTHRASCNVLIAWNCHIWGWAFAGKQAAPQPTLESCGYAD